MLSFPEWLKPIRRHSATSLISSSSMATQTGGNKDLRYGIYSTYQNPTLVPYSNPSNHLNQFSLIESSSDIKDISHKHSKSPWGRVRMILSDTIYKTSISLDI